MPALLAPQLRLALLQISRNEQAKELAQWGQTLEIRVREQVKETERLGQLKRFFSPQVAELIKQLKTDGISIFLISHDIHDVFDLADRVAVMKNGQIVGAAKTDDVTKDEVLGMIILGKCPAAGIPGPGAMNE